VAKKIRAPSEGSSRRFSWLRAPEDAAKLNAIDESPSQLPDPACCRMNPIRPVKVFEASVVVPATRHEAFDVWTRPDELLRIWSSFDEVRMVDERRYLMKSHRDGQTYEILAEIMLQIPGRRVAWRTISGPESSGVVCFESEPAGGTCVTLKLRYPPDGGWQQPELVEERVHAALAAFRSRIEQDKLVKGQA
jgi:uncharacterized membrane protein